MPKTITMIHSNYVEVEGEIVHLDRKFLTGMRRYASTIQANVVTVNPLNATAIPIMDKVSIHRNDLGFNLIALDETKIKNEGEKILSNQISNSSLIYGTNWNAHNICDRLKIPYIMVLECDLKTQISKSASQVNSKVRKLSRTLKTTARYLFNDCKAMHGAIALHCNGYPAYDESRFFNNDRLMYLDSRMSADMLIPRENLTQRFASRNGRRLRLLYSGRYESIKGTLDVVNIALQCIQQGLNIELNCYGSGSLRDEMRSLAGRAPAGSINIFDSIPYPELVRKSYESDLFICCHIQSDPSCTYLESFGAGLPIVGYGNRMWKRLCTVSQAGDYSPIGDQKHVVKTIQELIKDERNIDNLSNRARDFALTHTFENEFKLRTDDLNRRLATL